MVTIKHKGNFGKLRTYFTKVIKKSKPRNIEMMAEACLEQLKAATPKDSGITAESWAWEYTKTRNKVVIYFTNSNIQNGNKIVLLLEYGHATNGGGWVSGQHFVEPIIQKTYNDILNKTWKEMKAL